MISQTKLKNQSEENKIINQLQLKESLQIQTTKIKNQKHNSNDQNCIQQNIVLKAKNKQLLSELSKFSYQLDDALRQRKRSSLQVQNMQLQNAYKRCEIYKKQIALLKRNARSDNHLQKEDYQRKITQLVQENHLLKEEIKALTKIIKAQSKGLLQLGEPNYGSIAVKNQKLKEELCKMQGKIANIEQKEKLKNNLQQPRKKKSLKIVKTYVKDYSALQSKLETYKDMIIKDEQKIRMLTLENRKLRMNIDTLQNNNTEKQKQIVQLKQKIQNLRLIIRNKTHRQRKTIRISTNQSLHLKKSFNQHEQLIQMKEQNSITHQQEEESRECAVTGLKLIQYPRIQKVGMMNEGTSKWNDLQLSRLHQDGHIRTIRTRYQKGTPSQQMNSASKWVGFICQENSSEHIRHISGIFQHGFLQFILIKSNIGRQESFGDKKLKAQQFKFHIQKDQYPCALFGEISDIGITEFGCFIQKFTI